MRVFIVLLLFFQVCNSQTECFDVLFEGYNISSVTDDDQFIWVGTYDEGLISYDKYTDEIEVYNTSNSTITSNSVLSVLRSNNRMYISFENSLMVFMNDSFEEISTTIQGAMTIAPNGNLAVAAPYEFNVLDLDNQITYTKDLLSLVTPSCCGMSTDMEYDINGKLWISNFAFYEYDIITYDGITWDVHDTNNSILPIESPNFLNGITSHNNITMASNWSGLFKFENNIWKEEHSQNNPSVFNDVENIEGFLVNAIEYDLEGTLWLAAGEYDNTGSGKIAYKNEDDWMFLQHDLLELPGVNIFTESLYDSNIMYAASNDGLLIINTSCLPLSIDEFDEGLNLVSVFPNPTNGVLNLNSRSNEPFSFQLINSLGQIVLAQSDYLNKTIDLSKFDSGVYYLVIKLKNSIINKKILKFN